MNQQGRFYAVLHPSGVERISPDTNPVDGSIMVEQPICRESGIEPGDSARCEVIVDKAKKMAE
ncbi:MAG: hypothetical protein ACLPT4_00510 [Verrucomicrobiia bacterium]